MRIINYSGVKDYSPIIQDEICNLRAGEKLIVEGGTMKCSTGLDLSMIKPQSVLEFNSVLVFDKSVEKAIHIEGKNLYEIDVFFNAIRMRGWANNPDYDEYEHTGLYIKHLYQSNIRVNSILGFGEGIVIESEGQEDANGNLKAKGSYYNEIHFRGIRQCKTCMVLRTKNHKGFINSNIFFGGIFAGYNGLVFEGNNGQDPFNNNAFYGLGFENIINSVCKLRYSKGNSFYSPRFEQGKQGLLMQGGWIDEDLTNQSNHFFIDLPIYKKAFSNQNGKMSEVHGHIMDNSGKILGRGKINNWKGQGSYITP